MLFRSTRAPDSCARFLGLRARSLTVLYSIFWILSRQWNTSTRFSTLAEFCWMSIMLLLKVLSAGLISTLHEMYGRLITDHDWPALATKLPQSNNAAAANSTITVKSSDKGAADTSKSEIKCFRWLQGKSSHQRLSSA